MAGLTHILRHRIQSPILPDLTQTNLNYNFLVPPSIRESEFYHEFLEICHESSELERRENNFYYRLVSATFPMITSINARELFHIFKLRLCDRAQWEIREIAEKMLAEVKKKSNILFKKTGPSCIVLGYCPEGSHTCGKINEMKEKYL